MQIRKAPQAVSDAVPERKRSTPMNPANTIRKTHSSSSVSQRPYRDRVIHLLALKAYKKPELLARLQKDGVNQKDKNSLGAILQQVRTAGESSFCLPSCWGVHLRRLVAVIVVIIIIEVERFQDRFDQWYMNIKLNHLDLNI